MKHLCALLKRLSTSRYSVIPSKKILTLDKVKGVSIREIRKISDLGVDLKKLAENLIQLFDIIWLICVKFLGFILDFLTIENM